MHIKIMLDRDSPLRLIKISTLVEQFFLGVLLPINGEIDFCRPAQFRSTLGRKCMFGKSLPNSLLLFSRQ